MKQDNRDRTEGVSWLERLRTKALELWDYCNEGVWSDTRRNWKVNLVKTANLSVKSFLDSDLQTRAASLTYSTLLALVPCFALLFAIGRGFGFQNLMKTQLFKAFPAQSEAIGKITSFVDSYLSQASQGVFVGVGIVFLLWTLISLMGNIEESFNRVWGVTSGRSIGRKIIDYTAIMFLLPILVICSSGISIFVSSVFVDNPRLKFLSSSVKVMLDVAPFVLTWVTFTATYLIFPNTRVNLKNAAVSGIISGTAFQVLQYLFVTGTIYVSKYNAIYGSFAFLPLLLIWLQLVWTITLAGAVLCYSSQNIFQFNFSVSSQHISLNYRRKVAIAIMAVVVRRFVNEEPPMTLTDFSAIYHLPARLTGKLIDEMCSTGLLSIVITDQKMETVAYQPALAVSDITLGLVLGRLNGKGAEDFIPGFKGQFAPVVKAVDKAVGAAIDEGNKILLKDLHVNFK